MKKLIVSILILSAAIFMLGCSDDTPENAEDKVVDNSAVDFTEEAPTTVTEDTEIIDTEEPEEIRPAEPEVSDIQHEPEIPEAPETTDVPAEPLVPDQPEEEFYHVTGIKLSMYEVSVYPGEKRMPIVTMNPANASDKREIWNSSDTSIATVDSLGNIMGVAPGECTVTVTSVDTPSVSATVKVTVNKDAELTYIDGILIVNKTYPLPKSYAPGWETEASGPLWEMIAAAKADGIKLWMTSGYRSYYDQEYIYNGYVKRDGQEEADTYSARPGHSEHQTGLAYDLNDLSRDFGETEEGKWVAENCHNYGFIIRYPKDKEEITGYIYEPWHVRYLGVEKATEVYESGLCLEEFLDITSVYS